MKRKFYPVYIILETAVQDDKMMQDFDLESLTIEGEHSQKVKTPPIVSGYSSKNCVNLPFSTAVFRIIACFIFNLGMVQGDDTTEKNFTEIYDQALWGKNEEGLGYSGRGSNVSNAKLYMEFLQNFLKANNIHSVVDVGCGDWTFSRYMNWEGIDYLGYDIVKKVIEGNSARFSSPSIRFIYGNAIHMDLPEADLLICKDVLQHLNNEEIFLFLTQLHKFKYCLITNDIDLNTMSGSNHTIVNGEYRTLDLTAPPFNVIALPVQIYEAEGDLKQVLLIMN